MEKYQSKFSQPYDADFNVRSSGVAVEMRALERENNRWHFKTVAYLSSAGLPTAPEVT